MNKIEKRDSTIICLDATNEKARRSLSGILIGDANKMNKRHSFIPDVIKNVDIVLVHYWDSPFLAELFAEPIPDCRMVWWCHKNIKYSQKELDYPDLWIDTSPVQLNGWYIWSTGDISRFLNLQPKPHKRFNVGYVGAMANKKLHPSWDYMCQEIIKKIPDVLFTVVGASENSENNHFRFIQQIDDIVPYLSEFDILGYPLHPNHTGTCEQVLGEAMAAGVVPVVMDNPAERSIVNESGMNGFVEKSKDDYVNAIETLYHLFPHRRVMSYRARERAKELYSLDTMIQKWNEVFTEMMLKPKMSRKPL
jgi:L-malate glycosyltransferase